MWWEGVFIIVEVNNVVHSDLIQLTVHEDGDIRLVGGATALEGRVEMCYSGVWGMVCHNEWGTADVAVTCRQLEVQVYE